MTHSQRCQHIRSRGWTVDESFHHPNLDAKVCCISNGTIGALLYVSDGRVIFDGPLTDEIDWQAFVVFLDPTVRPPIPVKQIKQREMF